MTCECDTCKPEKKDKKPKKYWDTDAFDNLIKMLKKEEKRVGSGEFWRRRGIQ